MKLWTLHLLNTKTRHVLVRNMEAKVRESSILFDCYVYIIRIAEK